MPPSLIEGRWIIKLEMIGDFFQMTRGNVIRGLLLGCLMIEPTDDGLVDENFVDDYATVIPQQITTGTDKKIFYFYLI